MADAGVPVHVLRNLAGHGSLVTTQRYLHPDAQSIAVATTALSAHLTAKWSQMVPSFATWGSLRPLAPVGGSHRPALGTSSCLD